MTDLSNAIVIIEDAQQAFDELTDKHEKILDIIHELDLYLLTHDFFDVKRYVERMKENA